MFPVTRDLRTVGPLCSQGATGPGCKADTQEAADETAGSAEAEPVGE
jgi:hypothetical protein